LEQQDTQKRMLIAMVLSFAILVGYSYIFPPKKPSRDLNATTQTTSASKAPKSNIAEQKAAPATPATAKNTQPASTPTQSSKANIISTIKSKNYIFKIDNLGRIASAKLLKDKYKDANGNYLELFDDTKALPLEVRFADASVNEAAFKINYEASSSDIEIGDAPQTLILTQKLPSTTITKKLTFYPDGHYDIDVQSSKPLDIFLTPGHRPEVDHSRYLLVRGSLVRDNKGVTTTVEDGKAKKVESIPDATIVSSFDRYDASLFYNFDAPMSATIDVDASNNPLPFVSGKKSIQIHGYIGPKEWKTLQKINPELTNAIEFGWFTFLSRPFFKVMLIIKDYVGNWGWAIILFTLLVKLVLFPLSYKGMMSMNKMRELAPKIQELKEKYGKDPMKMNQQTMELYKKHGANPMGGCLPMLLQIPVFFALYRVLLNATELQGAHWIGWIHNLADKDPYYVLPILMGVSMFVTQKLQPNTMTDPMQKKIFQWFPAIMTLFFLTFPAGLVLYWLTNNILTIAQQAYINHAYNKYKENLKRANSSKSEE